MKILVTGGSGFIGSHLTERLLKEGHQITVLDSLLRGNKLSKDTFDHITFIKGDIRDLDLVIKASIGCDVIVHMAAVLGVDIVADTPIETMDVEVIGCRNVVTAAEQNNVKKVIYASTSGIYGHSVFEKALSEEVLVDPKSSYAMAKRYNEIYLASHHQEKGLNTISLRFFNVYGVRQDTRMVVPLFFEQALSGQPITVYGSGEQTRDFTFIDDTIEACVRCIALNGSRIINIANEEEYQIKDVALAIKEITDSESEIHFIEAPKKRYDYEVGRRVGSSAKLHKLTNYKPSTKLYDGLKSIYESQYKNK
ncbi:MAG: UDP-glucose 4-epimerase [Psychromonas sp.]|jgi:UDP-glucose 4-epimerase